MELLHNCVGVDYWAGMEAGQEKGAQMRYNEGWGEDGEPDDWDENGFLIVDEDTESQDIE